MDEANNPEQIEELTALLSSLQAFSINYLQKNPSDKNFLYQVINSVHELESTLADAKNSQNVTGRLSDFRKKLWNLIENNEKQPNDFQFDTKLSSLLTNYYLKTIAVPSAVPAEIIPEQPSRKEKVTPKSLPEINKIDQTLKLLEKSKIYIPSTKTVTVGKLENKYEEILHRLHNKEVDARNKAAFIGNTIPELHEIYKKLESNTEIVLTTIQATEIKNIVTLLEELKVLYESKARDEMLVEQSMAQEMQQSQDIDYIASKGNELTKLYMSHGKLKQAQDQAKTNALFVEQKIKDSAEKALSFELYADLLARSHQHAEAKGAYEKAAEILRKLSSVNYQNQIMSLQSRAKISADHEEEAILKKDKDLHALFEMQEILQKSGDVQLAHLAGTAIKDLHTKLVDPKLKPNEKVKLINDFGVRWHKYLDSKHNATTKPEWYTPEMEYIIKEKLSTNMRTLREMFSAQIMYYQEFSQAAMIEAKEKAKDEAQLRAESEAKARRDALLAKAEASRARIEAEKLKQIEDDKAKAAAKLRIEEEQKQAAQLAIEQARLEEEAKMAEKARYQELQQTRKRIAKLMIEAKEWLDKAEKNAGRHEFKIYLQEEEKKLKEAIDLFSVIKTEERNDSDLTSFAKSLFRLGVALKNQGKFNDAEEYLSRAGNIYKEIVNKQNYANLATVKSKLETQAEMGRIHYLQKNYLEAENYFDLNITDLDTVLSKEEIDDSFKSSFQLSALQNQAYALLMAKLGSESNREEIAKSDNMIETLYHAANLQKKLNEDEYKLVHQLLSLDKNLIEKSARVVRLQEILINLERPIQKRVTIFQRILEEENAQGPLDVIDKNLLQVYFEDLVNLAFVGVLKNAAEILPKDMTAFVAEIKAVRNELRNGQDVKLATLGLTLEQKIVYAAYEKQLAELEFRASENKQPKENVDLLLKTYLQEYFQTKSLKPKTKRRWIGKMLTAFKRRRKLKNSGKLSAAK